MYIPTSYLEPTCIIEMEQDGSKLSMKEEDQPANHSLREVDFKCTFPECEECFPDSDSLIRHVTSHYALPSDYLDQFQCSMCNNSFYSAVELEMHASVEHATHMCGICKKIFLSGQKLNRHKWIHTKERPFKCDFCQKSFKYKAQLKTHTKIHTGEKDFKCDLCNYASTIKQCLISHRRRRHARVLDFKCLVCGKCLPTNIDLDNHKLMHGKEDLKCSFCSKTFANGEALSEHVSLSHANQNNLHPCKVCSANFDTISSLMKHMTKHTDTNKFTCEICGKVLTSSSSLTVHRRRHSGEKPFACDVCGKAFISNNYLITHKRVHTGEKPYECNECGKAFTQQSTLIVHKRYHSGVRPYPCDICPKAFVTKTLLGTHKKIHGIYM